MPHPYQKGQSPDSYLAGHGIHTPKASGTKKPIGQMLPTGTGGFGPAPGPDTEAGFWHLADDGWQWISYNDGSGDTGSNSGSFSSGPTLAEQLALLEAKYGWDSKLELEMLEKEYGLRGHFEDERFKDAKELQKMDAASRLDYLQKEIGLTKDMKIELMALEHGNAIFLQDDRQEFEAVMAADDRDFREGESLLNRELEEKLQGLDIESREALAEARIAAERAMQAAQIAADQSMQKAGFGHAEKMQVGQQAFDKVMQEKGFKHDEFMQERELTVRIAINATQIESQEKISENKIQADKDMQATQISFDKEQKEEDRKLRRFEEVQALRGKDPVRAALMAMGAGDSLDAFGGSFGGMESMVIDGVDVGEGMKTATQSALQGIEGLGAAGETITLGDTGIEGLQSVEKAGASFVQSGSASDTANKILIRSAQGVGGSTQAGVSEQQVEDRISAITPKGFDMKRAAGGVGPHLIPMVQQQYAAEGRGPQINAPRAVEMNANRPAVESNTSYTVGEGQKGDGTKPEVVTTGDNKELLSIEPATDDSGIPDRNIPRAQQRGVREPYLRGGRRDRGDPLVDMFNDPDLKLGRNELPPISEQKETPIIAQQQQAVENFKAKQAKQMQDEMAREGINPKDMKQIQAIKASGQPLSPEQEKALAKYDRIVGQYQQSIQDFEKQTLSSGGAPPVPELTSTTPGVPTTPGGSPAPNVIGEQIAQGPRGFTRQQNMDASLVATEQAMTDRRRAYMESLPPAQQAQIRQTQQRGLAAQQDQLVKNLTPETIQKLMELINNPGRQVNTNLQEQLPQLRDGAGNLQTSRPRGLAQVV